MAVTFYKEPSSYLYLPNPKLGDTQRLDLGTKFFSSMADSVYSKIRTPINKLLNISFINLLEEQKESLIEFFTAQAGNQLIYTDYLGDDWLGYLNLSSLDIRAERSGRYNINMEYITIGLPYTPFDVGTGKTYSTIGDAQTACQGSMTNQGEYRIRVYAGGVENVYEERVNLTEGMSGEDSDDFVSMYAMVPHYGLLDQGIQIYKTDPSGAYNYLVKLASYSRIVGFRLKYINSYYNGDCNPIYTNGITGALVDRCIIQDSTQTKGEDVKGINIYNSTNIEVRNFIINHLYASSDVVHGIVSQQSNGTKIRNGVIWNLSPGPRAYGIYANLNTGTCIIRNVYGGNCGGQAFKKDSGTFDIDYCTSDDGSADDYGGSYNESGKAGADQFINPGTNFKLKAGSDLIGNGQNLSNYFGLDIAKKLRTSPWDRGAFKYV